MNTGLLLAFAAYAAFSAGDSAIKALGHTPMSTFEITFFGSLFTGIAMLVSMRPKGERWRDVFRMRHPVLLLIRSVGSLFAGVLGVVALVSIPFAETYALIFTAPFLVIILSRFVLGERITPIGIVAMIVGFAGVLIAVRPGLRVLEPGHFAAGAAAFFVALSTTLIRRIAPTEKRTSLLLMPQLVTTVVAGAIAATHFVTPTPMEFGLLMISGGFIALAQLAILLAARLVPAGTIGQAQFSQLIWAIVLGALFFSELPDLWSIVGAGVIIAGGLLTLSDRRQKPVPLLHDP